MCIYQRATESCNEIIIAWRGGVNQNYDLATFKVQYLPRPWVQ